MAARKFRWRVDGGAWTYETEELPFTLATVTSAQNVDVEPIGTAISLASNETIYATVTPAMSALTHGGSVEDVTNWSTFLNTSNYTPMSGRTIASVTVSYLGNATAADDVLAAGETAGFVITVTDSEGYEQTFTATAITVTDVAPSVVAAPVISGSPVVDGNLTSTTGTFGGTNLVTSTEWQISNNGVSGWVDTDDVDLTSPALILGQYLRVRADASNSAGTATSYSNVIGPVAAAQDVSVIEFGAIEAQGINGNVSLNYDIDANDSGVQFLLALASSPKPTASLFGANSGADPSDGLGAGYLTLGTAALTVGGSNIALTIPDGLVSAGYQLWALPTGGGDADVVGTGSITLDTTPADLGTPSVTGGSTIVDWAFTPNKDSAPVGGYRLSLFPSGTNPSNSAIAAGTGAVATITGAATQDNEETGQFTGLTAGTYQPAIYFVDPVGNKTHVTLANVTVTAAANPLEGDAGSVYWYDHANTTRSGNDITAVEDLTGNGLNLTSTPGVFTAPQQTSAAALMAFDSSGPTIIQSPTKSSAGTRLKALMRDSAGSFRFFAVIDVATLGDHTQTRIFFSEGSDHGSNENFQFGARINSFSTSRLEIYCRARRFEDAYTITGVTDIETAGLGLILIEINVTQDTWVFYVNGVQKSTGAVTPGNFPNHSTGWVTLGAKASNTTAEYGATGGLGLIYITSTQDATALSNMRTHIADRFSITLGA